MSLEEPNNKEIMEIMPTLKSKSQDTKNNAVVIKMEDNTESQKVSEPELVINLDKEIIEELPDELKEFDVPVLEELDLDTLKKASSVPEISFDLNDNSADLNIEELNITDLENINEQPKKLTRNYSFFD